MKESEFLELLNLYLDHEISAADAERLEAELRQNHERRRVYREYCRMQQACKILAGEGTGATEGSGARTNVVPFTPQERRGRSRKTYYFAGSAVAAAACVALALVLPRNGAVVPPSAVPSDAGKMVESSPGPSRADQVVNRAGHNRGLVAVGNAPTAPNGIRVSLMNEPLVLSSSHMVAPLDRAVAGASAEMDQLAWMRNFQLVAVRQPSEIDHLRFGTTPANLRPDARRLGTKADADGTVEMTSFRFVK